MTSRLSGAPASTGKWNNETVSYTHLDVYKRQMLRIPVYAHNIPDDQIYRPSAWGLHGTADPEGADFRACANYCLLYTSRCV